MFVKLALFAILSSLSAAATSTKGKTSQCIGMCTTGLCPTGYSCDTKTFQCCPSAASEPLCGGNVSGGPCIMGSCPSGFSCDAKSSACCSQTANPPACGGKESFGPCIENSCATGFTCEKSSSQCCKA